MDSKDAKVFIGPLFLLLLFVADLIHPLVWRVLWLALAVQLTRIAKVIWERTRLPRWALGSLLLAGFSFSIALVADSTSDAQNWVWDHPILVVGGLVVAVALLFSEAKFAPAKWKRVRERGESATLRDMFTLRHIPDLR